MMVRSRECSLLCSISVVVAGCSPAWSPDIYSGDGVALDHGKFAGWGRYEVVLPTISGSKPGTHRFELNGLPTWSLRLSLLSSAEGVQRLADAGQHIVVTISTGTGDLVASGRGVVGTDWIAHADSSLGAVWGAGDLARIDFDSGIRYDLTIVISNSVPGTEIELVPGLLGGADFFWR